MASVGRCSRSLGPCAGLGPPPLHQRLGAVRAQRGVRPGRRTVRPELGNAGGRRVLRVAASSEPQQLRGGEAMALPLDYYKMLDVSGVCSRDSLARALEKSLSNPPHVGYSQQCLLARGSVLKRAVETLLDVQGRRAYDDALRTGEITEDVPDEFVPGVLALLLEAGDAQTVVVAGEEWLATHRRDPRARDVALSTALAHRTVAQDLVRKHGDAASACAMLEVALALLRQHRASGSLQGEVATALAELQPALACQLVALPVERFQERERGLQVAIAVLSGPPGGKRAMPKQQFLDRLAESLTAAEQLELYKAAGSRFAELPSELYEIALAYIAEAAIQGQPVLLEKALGALAASAAAVPPGALGQASDSGVRQLAERRAIDERHRRQVAYAVCQLLLGESQSAADALGLLPGANPAAKCERSMLAFIKANSPDREDLLPGMCVLAQRWVADVALGSFRGTQGAPFSLEGWFEDEGVRRYLMRRQMGPAAASPLVGAARRAATAAFSPLVSGLAGVLSLMGLLYDPQRQVEQEEAEEEEEALLQQEAAAHAHAAAAPAAALPAQREAAPGVGGDVPAGRSHAELTQAAAAPDMSSVDMRAARQARPKAIRPADLKPRHTARPELTAAVAAPPPSPPAPVAMPPSVPEAGPGEEFDANVAFAMQPIEQLTPLEGEERMWDSGEVKTIRWGRLAATVVLLASGGFLLGRCLLLRSTTAQQLVAAAPAAAPVAAAAAQQAAPRLTLSRAEAAAMIARWQAAKAAALGPQHDTKGLPAVLRGEVLQQWRDRAAQIQQKGWHYLHTMEGSQVNSVSVDAAAGVARVSATFREAVVAHRGAAEDVQAFRSEYSVDYELAKEGRDWVITAAAVKY
ncbi:ACCUMULATION AND REPLICATION OF CHLOROPLASTS chloroplastic [Micractinium conductrix]|uniref:ACCUMULATION AND REPLICATION OF CHLOROPLASTS chloroplastic n=1 Tax=Micractinium conductrix TaxID=554055 RepID=A0A2P6VEJ8_9CHLO|nr:ACCUMULATION AND REPLICATION OF CHLOROPLASTS chloroplastic [Micractinium conductrix]|eukprot:PSC72514.1 ACCUMULATION AND REPLICATION OF CHLOROPLASTS chloroplastic [Micractinium conductrix]